MEDAENATDTADGLRVMRSGTHASTAPDLRTRYLGRGMNHKQPLPKGNSNSVSLAGEFAVLSQLALRGYDANMVLGHTKGVDILVSDPATRRMYKLEVKTNYQSNRDEPQVSKVHGPSVSTWILSKKNEEIIDDALFYCFVNIARPTNSFRFYIVPSAVVARYVREEHALWLKVKREEGKKVKDSAMRIFRIGLEHQTYVIQTPTAERYENNWSFKK
jgi:hypothetical protein